MKHSYKFFFSWGGTECINNKKTDVGRLFFFPLSVVLRGASKIMIPSII